MAARYFSDHLRRKDFALRSTILWNTTCGQQKVPRESLLGPLLNPCQRIILFYEQIRNQMVSTLCQNWYKTGLFKFWGDSLVLHCESHTIIHTNITYHHSISILIMLLPNKHRWSLLFMEEFNIPTLKMNANLNTCSNPHSKVQVIEAWHASFFWLCSYDYGDSHF